MITKAQIAASMLHECDVSKHLFGKLTPGAMEYRPTPTQRSTVDLLRYLTYCGIGGLKSLSEANWKLFFSLAEAAKTMPAEEFPAAMDRQKAEIEAFFRAIDEHTLATQPAPLPGGGTKPLLAAILDGPFKWLAAYKLQLFLYAKATGATGIGTANAWAGIDWKG